MVAHKSDEPARIGPYVFTEEVPIDESLHALLTARRSLRGRRAITGLLIVLSPILMIIPTGLGASPALIQALGALSVFLVLGGLGYAAWYGTLHGSTVRHLRHGVVWRFELDAEIREQLDNEELPSSIEAFPVPMLLARVGDEIMEKDVPVTIGASEWPSGLGLPPTATGAGMMHG